MKKDIEKKTMTRRDFLGKSFFGLFFLLINPFSKKERKNALVSPREAKYYKNLAG